jgi:hypothetical protein
VLCDWLQAYARLGELAAQRGDLKEALRNYEKVRMCSLWGWAFLLPVIALAGMTCVGD